MITAVNGGFRLVFDGQVILCILVIFAKKGIRPFLAQKSKDAQENLARPRFRFGLITSGGASLAVIHCTFQVWVGSWHRPSEAGIAWYASNAHCPTLWQRRRDEES